MYPVLCNKLQDVYFALISSASVDPESWLYVMSSVLLNIAPNYLT